MADRVIAPSVQSGPHHGMQVVRGVSARMPATKLSARLGESDPPGTGSDTFVTGLQGFGSANSYPAFAEGCDRDIGLAEEPVMHSPFRPRCERVSRDLYLTAVPTAAGQARRFTRGQLRSWQLAAPSAADLPATAELITSELVTNAVKATGFAEMPDAAALHQLSLAAVVLRLRTAHRQSVHRRLGQRPRSADAWEP